MKRIPGALRKAGRLLRSDSGSGIITVILTVAFVMILGIVMLYMNLVNMQMKAADRQSRITFYSAESAMNEIRAGVQELVTDAIAAAYTSTLVQYSASSDDQDTFAIEFVNSLSGSALSVSSSSTTGSYDVGALEGYLSDGHDTNATVTGSGRVDVDIPQREVILRDLSVKYIRNGYETNISSDIKIKIPNFAYTVADYSLSRLYEFIIVADSALTDSSILPVTVRGNVYAGNVQLVPNALLEITDDSTVISGGNYTLGERASLNIEGTTWGRSILLSGAGSSVSISGKTYLKNDLVLAGEDSTASVSGTYYGFGNGSAGVDSSSIIVSGMETTLDFSSVEYFALAGRSYVSGGGAGESAGEVPMGGSLSVKSDQTAFLVPDSLLRLNGGRTLNPFILTDAQAAALNNPGVFTIDRTTPFLGSNSINSLGADVQIQIRQLYSAAGYKIIYVFMVFDDGAAANSYFEEYYEANKDKMDDYLGRYFKDLKISDALRAAGTFYIKDGSQYSLMIRGGGVDTIANQYSSNYANIISSLTSSSGGDPGITPFYHFVNVSAMSGLGNQIVEFTDSLGRVVGLIVPEGYYQSGNAAFTVGPDNPEYDDVNVIIALGDVVINREFTGLVMSSANINLMGSISYQHRADISLTSAAFSATNGTGKALIEYMNSSAGGVTVGGGGGTEISWVLEDIVVYSDWKKD